MRIGICGIRLPINQQWDLSQIESIDYIYDTLGRNEIVKNKILLPNLCRKRLTFFYRFHF